MRGAEAIGDGSCLLTHERRQICGMCLGHASISLHRALCLYTRRVAFSWTGVGHWKKACKRGVVATATWTASECSVDSCRDKSRLDVRSTQHTSPTYAHRTKSHCATDLFGRQSKHRQGALNASESGAIKWSEKVDACRSRGP